MTDATATRASRGFALGASAPWVFAIVLVFVLPFLFTDRSAMTILNQIAITIVFALSYNMLLGQGGMLSFGHAVYMGLGGFFVMHMMNRIENLEWFIPLPLLPLFGGLFGLAFAALFGSFSVRRAGTAFAMISLGIGELVAASSIIIVAFFGGEEGISGDRTMGPNIFGVEWFTPGEVYWVIAGWMLLSAFLMYLFSRTPAGRMANAVRDNPERAQFLGYNEARVRYISFCAAGFFAGVAGGLFAINYEILGEENLNLVTSGTILLVAFLGGAGFFFGPIVGAIVFTLLQTVLSLHTNLWQLYAGVLFVATVMFFPFGIAGLLAMHIAPWKLGRFGGLIVPYLKTLIPGVVGILGLAAFIEILHHAKHAPIGEESMTLFWTEFSHYDALPWVIASALAVGGFWLASRFAGEMKQAYEAASTLEGGK
ncbi:MAG: branched-chain amino acid ABC transporter permease [Pseudomonadota bacterium]